MRQHTLSRRPATAGELIICEALAALVKSSGQGLEQHLQRHLIPGVTQVGDTGQADLGGANGGAPCGGEPGNRRVV